jgi:hypothetical protein
MVHNLGHGCRLVLHGYQQIGEIGGRGHRQVGVEQWSGRKIKREDSKKNNQQKSVLARRNLF